MPTDCQKPMAGIPSGIKNQCHKRLKTHPLMKMAAIKRTAKEVTIPVKAVTCIAQFLFIRPSNRHKGKQHFLLIDAKHYVKNMVPPVASEANFDLVWGKSNPGWRDGLVAIVFFDSAQKTATLEEWVVGGMSKGIGKLQCEEEYEKRCLRPTSVPAT